MADEPMKMDNRAAGGAGFVGGLAAGVLGMGLALGGGAELQGGRLEIVSDGSGGAAILTTASKVVFDAPVEFRAGIFFTSDREAEDYVRRLQQERAEAYRLEEEERIRRLGLEPKSTIFETTEPR